MHQRFRANLSSLYNLARLSTEDTDAKHGTTASFRVSG